MSNNDIFLIDICGTVFRSNTTFDFIRFYYSETRWYKVMSFVRNTKIIGFVNSLVFEMLHVDIIRKFAICHLKGLKREDIADMAEKFYEVYLKDKINHNVVKIIEEQRSKGLMLVIVSATLDCISSVVAKKLNIDIQFSSQLAYDNNICQGFLQTDLLGSKLMVLKENGFIPPYYGIITDNYSDIDVIQCSDLAFLIQYSDARDKWVALGETTKNCKRIKITISKSNLS